MEIDVLLILSLLGAAMGVLLCLSPVPAFVKANKTNSIKEISRGFLVVSNLTALSWMLYSFKASILDILVPNIMQYCISLVLISVYHYIKGDSVLAMAKYCSLMTMVALAGIRLGDVELLGIIAIVFTTLSNLSQMDQVVLVLKERRAEYLDMTVNTASLIYNVIWFTYGILSHNLYVMLPNAFGFCASLFLFGLYVWAKSKSCWQPKKEQDECSHLAQAA
mmetsp:Transcript_9266/g.17720  ORF Transcript_9266/g.17720 Transcript_9266/m.17720 type:complete len:221 (+) Transcript_9266:3446-4108(+)